MDHLLTILKGMLPAACLVVLLLGSNVAGVAANSGNTFDEANKLYEQGRYPEAAAAYHSLLRDNKVSPEILYNLGNAQFKAGQLGRAIYNYRGAALLAPRDPDLQANLRFARSQVRGDHSVSESFLDRAATWLTINELATLTAIFLWVWLGFRIILKLRPESKAFVKTTSNAAAAFFAVFALWLAAGVSARHSQTAIAPGDHVAARFGPLDTSQTAFTVPDGTELRVAGLKEDWVQVLDRANRVGWLKRDQILLFP